MSGKKPVTTVVMSGGAPTSPLMAGFLYAVLDKKKQFTEFHTSGAGALMALLSLSPPKGVEPQQALRKWVESGVADELYAQFPVNFKLFRKPGPFAPLYQKLAERYKLPLTDPASLGKPDKLEKLLKEPGEPNPMTALLADVLASQGPPPSSSPTDKDPADRLQERLLYMWEKGRNEQTYSNLLKLKDPIKRIRDNFLTSWLKTDEQRRVYNDMVDLYFAAITPTTLNYRSKGLAAPLPFLEDVVDFDNLAANLTKRNAHIWVNAYNMTKEANTHTKFHRRTKGCVQCQQPLDPKDPMEMFKDRELTPQHIRAAFSMPFIYPPTVINGNSYSEGADQEPINFRILRENPGNYAGQKVVILDALGALEDSMVRPPRDLWDAYVISIMTPVVGLAKMSYEDFKQECGSEIDHEYIKWRVPEDAKPYVMDWSYSNLSTLFKVGYQEGTEFVDKHWA
jgi:hypothetical protein